MSSDLGVPNIPPPSYLERFIKEYDRLRDDDLIAALEKCATITLEQVLRSAAVVYVAASRGKDLRPILVGFFRCAALVAFGQLVPQAVVEFGGKRSILAKISRLPLNDQTALLERGTVTQAYLTEGGYDQREVPLKDLTDDVARQLFDQNRLFTVQEQVARLHTERVRQVRVPGLPACVRIDRKRHQVVIGTVTLRPSQVSLILSALAGDD